MTTKITATLETAELDQVREMVLAGRAAIVSAFVKHAVALALSDAEGCNEMLADALQQTGGPLIDAERAWADSLLLPQTITPTQHR